METELSLLRSIVEDPDNVELRLVAADWYEERNDPRAEFIRLQLALSRLPENHPWREEISGREQDLWQSHRRRWNAPVHRLINDSPLKGAVHARRAAVRDWRYHRGFIEELDVTAQAWLSQMKLFQRFGPIQRLRLRDTRAVDLRQLIGSGRLREFKAIDLSENQLFDSDFRRLCEHLSEESALRVLNVAGNLLSVESVSMLCEEMTTFVARLDRLVLSRNRFPYGLGERLSRELGAAAQQENGAPMAGPWFDERPVRDENEGREIPYDDSIRYEDGQMYREGTRGELDLDRFLAGSDGQMFYDEFPRTHVENPWDESAPSDLFDDDDDEDEPWDPSHWEEFEEDRWGRDEDEDES